MRKIGPSVRPSVSGATVLVSSKSQTPLFFFLQFFSQKNPRAFLLSTHFWELKNYLLTPNRTALFSYFPALYLFYFLPFSLYHFLDITFFSRVFFCNFLDIFSITVIHYLPCGWGKVWGTDLVIRNSSKKEPRARPHLSL